MTHPDYWDLDPEDRVARCECSRDPEIGMCERCEQRAEEQDFDPALAKSIDAIEFVDPSVRLPLDLPF